MESARRLARGRAPLHDNVCFNCQQSAEKHLKAVMEELGLTVPRTHILVAILPPLAAHYPNLRTLRRGLDFLTRFAVDTRYPGDNASKRQAAAALRWAGRVRQACRTILGVKPPRRSKKK